VPVNPGVQRCGSHTTTALAERNRLAACARTGDFFPRPELSMLSSARRALLVSLPMLAIGTACAGKKADPAPAPQVAASGSTRAATDTAAPGVKITDSTAVAQTYVALPNAPKRRDDRQLLLRDAILETQYTNMYDVVQALRGNWLRVRANASVNGAPSVLQVYLDNQRLSGVDELKSLAPTNIESVRFYDPVQASARWGLDHNAGALYLLTSKRPR
jgi:hypothetical protein